MNLNYISFILKFIALVIRTKSLIIILLLIFIPTSLIFGQKVDQEAFLKELLQVVQTGNQSQVDSLILKNRAHLKTAFAELLSEYMHSREKGTANIDEQSRMLETIAYHFQESHGERSLVLVYKNVAALDDEQILIKIKADSLTQQAAILRKKKDTRDDALNMYLECVDLYTKINDRRGQAIVYGGIGFIYWYKKDPDKALRNFDKGLEARLEIDDRDLIGNAYSDIGGIHLQFYRDYESAIQFYNKALIVRKQINDKTNIGKTLIRMGRSYEYLGKYQHALKVYTEAVSLYGDMNNFSREIAALNDCGIVLKEMALYSDALEYATMAVDKSRAINDTTNLAHALNTSGDLNRRMGGLEKAYTYYNESLSLWTAAGNRKEEAASCNSIGMILSNLQRYDQANSIFNKGLQVARELDDKKTEIAILSNMALALGESQKYDQAVLIYKQAIVLSEELNNNLIRSNNLLNLANLYNEMNRLPESEKIYRDALQFGYNSENLNIIWPVLLGLGDNFERRGNYTQALYYYDQSLEIIETMRYSLKQSGQKSSFFGQLRYIYEAIAHLQAKLWLEQGDYSYMQKAFASSEQAKARVFLDLINKSGFETSEWQGSENIKIYDSLRHEIFEQDRLLNLDLVSEDSIKIVQNKKNRLKIELETVKNNFTDQHPELFEVKNQVLKNPAEIQKDIRDDNTLILSYLVGDSSTVLWAISKDDLSMYMLPARKVLSDQIEVFRYALLDPEGSQSEILAKSGYKLYNYLLYPARDMIDDATQLIIMPDDILYYVPFEAVIAEQPDADNSDYTSWQFLINDFAIQYSSSASIYRAMIHSEPEKSITYTDELLAIGDPVYGNENGNQMSSVKRGNFSRLIYSKDEINNISGHFDESRQSILMRKSATEGQVKEQLQSKKFRYIHFATHGVLNEHKPDYSALVLTQNSDPNQDGFLQADEILGLDIQTDLVVLSACQTALGKMVPGEGIIGLNRSFMYAGASSIVSTLWSVYDESTAELMTLFYQNLIQKEYAKARALQAAKVELLENEKYAHPFYWAPFVLMSAD